jgi:hypothetical protein
MFRSLVQILPPVSLHPLHFVCNVYVWGQCASLTPPHAALSIVHPGKEGVWQKRRHAPPVECPKVPGKKTTARGMLKTVVFIAVKAVLKAQDAPAAEEEYPWRFCLVQRTPLSAGPAVPSRGEAITLGRRIFAHFERESTQKETQTVYWAGGRPSGARRVTTAQGRHDHRWDDRARLLRN